MHVKVLLAALNSMKRKAMRLDRRKVLSVFFRLYFRQCGQELSSTLTAPQSVYKTVQSDEMMFEMNKNYTECEIAIGTTSERLYSSG